MWNTLFATSFKYAIPDLEMDMDMSGMTVFKDTFSSSAPVNECLTPGTTGFRAQGRALHPKIRTDSTYW